nr:MAG TPA: hypothetical protein [Caudoviricetes sp.]
MIFNGAVVSAARGSWPRRAQFYLRLYDYKTSYSRLASAPEMAQRGNKRDAINGKGIWTSLGRGNKNA